MSIEGGNPTPEEIAAIMAAIDAMLGFTQAPSALRPAVSPWRMAGRLSPSDPWRLPRAMRKLRRYA